MARKEWEDSLDSGKREVFNENLTLILKKKVLCSEIDKHIVLAASLVL